MATIRLEKVSKRFGRGGDVLQDVALEVRDREVLTIVGPSGCGKSTLLRIIAGLEAPTAGHVHIDGQDVTAVPARDRNIAMVFQSYALYPHMTCFENLAFNLRLKKLDEKEVERRVRDTAGMLQIDTMLEKYPRELSGGQRQRVAVGRALIRDPRAFLLDEPLSNLDALLRERVRHELKELFKKINATVIYVTHDQVEAMTLADRVVVLDRGRVQQVGAPDDLYWSPENRFVASFIGSPSMNIMDVQLENGMFRLGGAEFETGANVSGAVSVGIRPEALRAGKGARGNVSWIENLGAQFLVGVNVDDVHMTMLTPERPPTNSIELSMEPAHIHVFDQKTGRTLDGARVRGPARSQLPAG